MAIIDKQREERKKFLGSSDIAALFTDEQGKSLDPFKTAGDVWALKTFEQEPGDKQSKSMSIGHRYESALIEFAKQELGCEIYTDPSIMRFICKEHPIFACNLDGYTSIQNGNPYEIVEVKTTGLTGEWGEPGTDDVPFRVNLQVHQQMLCTGWKKAHIAVLLGKWGLTEEMYLVERNETIITAIIERGEQFWNDHVLTKTPPPKGEVGNIEIFKRIVRQPASFAEVDSNTVYEWMRLRQERLTVEKDERSIFAEILLHLGDAEGVKLNNGSIFTYFQQTAHRVDTKLLKAEYPTVYDAVLKESKSRVASIRKGKTHE